MFVAWILAAFGAARASGPIPIDPGSWFTSFSYPPEAAKRRVDGTVGFEVDVNAAGAPVACRVTSSSGSPLLDQPTCAIIMSKARFHPAMDENGSPVAGHYSNKTVWQLHVDHGPQWFVAIVDLTDPKHPTCAEEAHGGGMIALNCKYLLRQKDAFAEIAKTMSKVAYLSSMAFDGDQPFAGDPAWGQRLSYSLIDTYRLNGMSDCQVIAAAGQDAGKGLSVNKDACGGFKDDKKLRASLRSRAAHIKYETAVFGIRRANSGSSAASR